MKSNLKWLIAKALDEDRVSCDVTSRNLIPRDLKVTAQIVTKEDCVVSGLDVADLVFKSVDPRLKVKKLARDGKFVRKASVLVEIYGSARSILSAERVALNFLSHLCAVATLTRKFVKSVSGLKVKILDTRKTTPALRELEKYAVRCGGGFNHRFNLRDLVLIKDNHKKALSLALEKDKFKLLKIIKSLKTEIASGIKIEIEVENIKEFKQIITARPDIIMLDNMPVKAIKTCVSIRNNLSPRTLLEASGGINLKTIRSVGKSGVDLISIGSLTHSPAAIDLSLEVQ